MAKTRNRNERGREEGKEGVTIFKCPLTDLKNGYKFGWHKCRKKDGGKGIIVEVQVTTLLLIKFLNQIVFIT
jgi:hypothetical protein